MCYQTVSIRHPRIKSQTTHFNPECDNFELNVPCNKCGECTQSKQNEYMARIYYEYLHTIECGGFSYFDTFTYSEDKVPTFHGMMVFDQRDYQLFMKRLRKNLSSDGYKVSHYENGKSVSDLKVFWCSEYGGVTHRPHYHAIFFITFDITAPVFFQYLEKSWQHGILDIYKKDKKTGFVRYKTPQEKVLNSFGAISYTAKYLGKDIDFLTCINEQKNSEFKEWFVPTWNRLNDYQITKNTYITYSMLGYLLNHDDLKLNYVLPFSRHSQGLGKSILEKFSLDELLSGYITVPDKVSVVKTLPLPSYIIRKLFYDYDKGSRCYILNDLGIKWKTNKYIQNIDNYTDKLNYTVSNWSDSLPAEVVDDILTSINKKYGTSFVQSSDFMYFYHNLGISVSTLATYIIFYRHKSCGHYTGDFETDLNDYLQSQKNVLSGSFDIPDSGLQYPFPIYDYDVNKIIYPDFSKSSVVRYSDYLSDYEMITQMFELIRFKISQYKQNIWIRKQKEKSQRAATNLLT